MIQRPESRVGKTSFAKIEARGGKGMYEREDPPPPLGCLREGFDSVHPWEKSMHSAHAVHLPSLPTMAVGMILRSPHPWKLQGSVSASTSKCTAGYLVFPNLIYHEQERG